MLEDYCNRLQELNRQKNQFLKLKYKNNTKTVLQKQQNKYHKYILTQISYKNKLDSLFKINSVIGKLVRNNQRQLFDLNKRLTKVIKQQFVESKKCQQSENKQSRNLLRNSQELSQKRTDELKHKLKLASCSLLSKILATNQEKQCKMGFKLIQRNSKYSKSLQTVFEIVENKRKLLKNVFFQLLKNYIPSLNTKLTPQNHQHKSFIFSLNEFSQIIPYTIEQQSQQLSTSRIKNIQQIDSKFKPLSISRIQPPPNQQNEYALMIQSFQKLKEQVMLMKNLLSQKNKLLKSKDEQIYKLKKQYEKKIQTLHDELSAKIQNECGLYDSIISKSVKQSKVHHRQNSQSYLQELQTHIIGDRSPRGNIEQDQNISYQLLQKYMKQSFEMRQKMDMAREMCEQFQFDNRTQQGQIMIEIIKLLTPEERLNACID